MAELHPHWHATDANPAGKPAGQEMPHVALNKGQMSRRPAAIVGILAVLGIGFGFVQGVDYLTAQLVAEKSIIISDESVSPASVTVNPGGTLAWINNGAMPYYIFSESLCSPSTEECLNLEAVFPFETGRYTIPADTPAGTYEYLAETVGMTHSGAIVVEGDPIIAAPTPTAATQNPTEAPEAPDADFVPPAPVIPGEQDSPAPVAIAPAASSAASAPSEPTIPAEPIAAGTAGNDGPSIHLAAGEEAATDEPSDDGTLSISALNDAEEMAMPTLPPHQQAEIPRNPYTVGSEYVPFPGFNALPVATVNDGGSMLADAADTGVHSGAPAVAAHKPFTQPQTGPGLWLLGAIGIAGIAIMLRRTRPATVVAAPKSTCSRRRG